ncbi:MAG: CaiB/BaiF CoA transferase family protein [Burkholderiales bacterium]
MEPLARGALQGPLQGLRVIEICSTIAGPVCARLMADFGADVIKIEPGEGDPGRQLGAHCGDVSLFAASILRGKRSVVLDLKTPQGCEVARALIAQADILVENNRPGVMERLGLGYAALSGVNPGLVMVRISGYGQDGPYAERPGYGVICEAVAGVRHMTGDPDRPPSRVSLATTDYLSAVYAAFGAVSAIHERSRSGRGQVVDVALYEAAFSQMELHVPAYEKLGLVPTRTGMNVASAAPNSLYPTAGGGWVLIAVNNDAIFARLAAIMQQPALLTDERYATVRARGTAENTHALNAIVAQWTGRFPAAELEAKLREAEVPNARIYTMADIFADPHYAARGMLVAVPHPVLGATVQAGIVPKLSRTPGSIRNTGPDIGADTLEVLKEAGLSDAQIEALIAKNVVKAS